MKKYGCTHVVEAAQWIDTDENHEAFADWFDSHGDLFETRGPVVCLPEECGEATEGEWILRMGDDWVVMDDESFCAGYSETP